MITRIGRAAWWICLTIGTMTILLSIARLTYIEAPVGISNISMLAAFEPETTLNKRYLNDEISYVSNMLHDDTNEAEILKHAAVARLRKVDISHYNAEEHDLATLSLPEIEKKYGSDKVSDLTNAFNFYMNGSSVFWHEIESYNSKIRECAATIFAGIIAISIGRTARYVLSNE